MTVQNDPVRDPSVGPSRDGQGRSDNSAVAGLTSLIVRPADNSAQEVIEMTALTQTRRALAYRLAPSLTVALLITLGLGLALLALIASLVALPELMSPVSPYGPGGPDLQRNFV
jgi:hypothetical protein